MADLKRELRRWYDRHGVHPAEGRRQLAGITDISERTLEKVEQSGGFRYPAALLFILRNT